MVLNRVLSSASQLLRLNNPPQIVLVGHPTLRKPAKPIPIHEITSPKITSIINKMSSCFGKGLIGLAAPQIGEGLQIIAYNLSDPSLKSKLTIEQQHPLTFLINPSISPIDKTTDVDYESCESIPGFNSMVRRYSAIRLNAYDINGNPITESRIDGILARILQHEMDHLQGKTIVDRMEPGSLRSDAYVDKFEMHIR